MKFYLILQPLLENDVTFDKLKERYKEILADLVSARNKPDCSCRNRVLNFLEVKYKVPEEKAFLNELIDDNSIRDIVIDILNEDEEVNRALKTPHLIKKEDGYYEKFLNKLQETNVHHYVRSINIVDRGDFVEIFLFGYK
jgi:hypothetical protein